MLRTCVGVVCCARDFLPEQRVKRRNKHDLKTPTVSIRMKMNPSSTMQFSPGSVRFRRTCCRIDIDAFDLIQSS
jgi:hypothetical protein